VIAVTATDSLSNAPATDRIRCPGWIAITAIATTAEDALFPSLAASHAIPPVNSDARTENAAGMKTQTSFRETVTSGMAFSAL